MMDQTGKQLRDEGIESVAAHNKRWRDGALHIANLSSTRREVPSEFTGEDLLNLICDKIGPPGHPNAKGAVIMALVRGKVIEDTGRTAHMRNATAHSRRNPLYRWVPRIPWQLDLLGGSR